MRIGSSSLPLAWTADPEVAKFRKDPRGMLDFTPDRRTWEPGTLNLARAWTFPAGHADSLRCRRHSRSSVQMPVQIALYRRDGSSYDQGTGVIRDLSYSGLCLGDVFLAQGRLLSSYFAVGLRHAQQSPDGDAIAGRILRTSSWGFPSFGIEFLFPDSGAEARLQERRFKETADPSADAPSRGAPPSGLL